MARALWTSTSQSWHIKVKTSHLRDKVEFRCTRFHRFWTIALFAFFLCNKQSGAITITNLLNGNWTQAYMQLNVGDTIVWVNQDATAPTFTESYGGEWKSPALAAGGSFAYTFQQPGFYAYQTATATSYGSTVGTVRVSSWSNAPPSITLNTPVTGLSFPRTQQSLFLQASVTNSQKIALVRFFADATLIGVASNAPYAIVWTNSGPATGTPLPVGTHALVAEAFDTNGTSTATQPAIVMVGNDQYIWGSRVLPNGQFMFYYNARLGRNVIVAAADASFGVGVTEFGTFSGLGVFVDSSGPASGQPFRVYRLKFDN